MSYVSPACRGLIAAVFVLAVVGKVRSRASYAAFAESLAVPGLLPARMRSFAPGALVAAECATAVLVVIPTTEAVGLALGGALLALFAATVAWSLRRGVQVRCNCFGADTGAMDRFHVVRNVLLAVGALVGLVSTLIAEPAHTPIGLAAFVGGVLAGVLVTRWDDLRFLFSSVYS